MRRNGVALVALAVAAAGCTSAVAEVDGEQQQGASVAFTGHQEGTRTFDVALGRSGDSSSGFVRLRFGAERGGNLMFAGTVEDGELADDPDRQVVLGLQEDGITTSYSARPGAPCEVVLDRFTATLASGTFDCTLTGQDGAELTATGTFRHD